MTWLSWRASPARDSGAAQGQRPVTVRHGTEGAPTAAVRSVKGSGSGSVGVGSAGRWLTGPATHDNAPRERCVGTGPAARFLFTVV